MTYTKGMKAHVKLCDRFLSPESPYKEWRWTHGIFTGRVRYDGYGKLAEIQLTVEDYYPEVIKTREATPVLWGLFTMRCEKYTAVKKPKDIWFTPDDVAVDGTLPDPTVKEHETAIV